MKEKPVWGWWSVPNTSFYSRLLYYMRKKVSLGISSSFSLYFLYLLTNLSLFLSYFEGECVAQFKFTVLLMANGPLRITSGPFEAELYKSEHDIQDPELKVCFSHFF